MGKCKILTASNEKGGVGKSITVASLSVGLARVKKSWQSTQTRKVH